jgi:hypothetical protein
MPKSIKASLSNGDEYENEKPRDYASARRHTIQPARKGYQPKHSDIYKT